MGIFTAPLVKEGWTPGNGAPIVAHFHLCDTEAERPACPFDGCIAFTADSKKHWSRQNSAWTEMGGAAGGPHTHPISDINLLQAALDGKTDTGHAHVQGDVTGLVSALAAKQDVSAKGAANGYAELGADGKVPSAQLPASGSDPWTYLRTASDFTTTSATAVDVTGLAFTPVANTRYEIEAALLLRTATATVNPRPGLAWAAGLTDGGAWITQAQAAAGAHITVSGNHNAALLEQVGGLPNTTQSWPAFIRASAIAGAAPSGTIRVQLASETAGTTVTVKAGSWLKYRTVP